MRETLRVWLEGTRIYGTIIKARRFLYNVRIFRVKQPFGERRLSFWKVLLFVIVISALAGIILAILIPTVSPEAQFAV